MYAGGATLRLDDVGSVIARTDGVAAAFVKELMRKSALFAAIRDDSTAPLEIVDDDVGRALDELLLEGSALTRSLLGGGDGSQPEL